MSPNSWMMSTICFIPVVIMDSVSKNLLSCFPRCPLTFITLSSTATISPVSYFENPKPLTSFLTISSNHGLPDISMVSISFHTFKKFITHIELLPSCTIIVVQRISISHILDSCNAFESFLSQLKHLSKLLVRFKHISFSFTDVEKLPSFENFKTHEQTYDFLKATTFL